MYSKNKLKIYCPLNEELLLVAVRNKFHLNIVNFEENKIFKKLLKYVIKYLDSLNRYDLVNEGIRFYYHFLKGQPTAYVRDYSYYPKLTKYFINKNVFDIPIPYTRPRILHRYVTLVYKVNRFFFVQTFASINEMCCFFNYNIKKEKNKYIIWYK